MKFIINIVVSIFTLKHFNFYSTGEIVEKDTRSKEDIEDSRWAGFVNFRRRVQEDKPDGNGRVNTVMLGTDEILDILPGVRKFQSIFNFDDLVITPKFTEIKGVQWCCFW